MHGAEDGSVTRQTNFEDDIFYLNVLIRTLRGGLKLQLDEEYFTDRLQGDLAFVDQTIDKLYDGLRASAHMVRRVEHVRELRTAKMRFVEFLGEVMEQRLPGAEFLRGMPAELGTLRDHHERDLAEMSRSLREAGDKALQDENMISDEELRVLLAEEEAEDAG